MFVVVEVLDTTPEAPSYRYRGTFETERAARDSFHPGERCTIAYLHASLYFDGRAPAQVNSAASCVVYCGNAGLWIDEQHTGIAVGPFGSTEEAAAWAEQNGHIPEEVIPLHGERVAAWIDAHRG